MKIFTRKLKKVDRRFKLYSHGFTCYLEFDEKDWITYNKYVRACRTNLGNEFWYFNTYEKPGNWRSESNVTTGKQPCKRIYFRGDKYYTLIAMAIPLNDNNTIYL